MTRVSQCDILDRWDTLLGDPLLSFESLKQKAEQGGLETNLRSLCWRVSRAPPLSDPYRDA